jgi:hypothetical protein
MSVTNLYNGMMGDKDAKVVIPSCNLPVEQFTNRDPQIGRVKYEVAPNILSAAIDYSTARGVLPCIGITTHVLRSAPISASNAYQVPQGTASFSQPGLATQSYRNDYIPLPPMSSINIGVPSNL